MYLLPYLLLFKRRYTVIVHCVILGQITRRFICEKFLKTGLGNRQQIDIINEIESYLNENKENKGLRAYERRDELHNFITKWISKWRSTDYSWERFTKKNAEWLDKPLFDTRHEEQEEAPGPSKRKCFSDLSSSQKNKSTKGKATTKCWLNEYIT